MGPSRILPPLVALAAAACGRNGGAGPDPGHAHEARAGGRLIGIGDHFAQIEPVHDPREGELSARVRDGCAESVRPMAMPPPPVMVRTGGNEFAMALAPAESPQTGDRRGSGSHFEGRSDRLVGVRRPEGVFGAITFGDLELPGIFFRHGD